MRPQLSVLALVIGISAVALKAQPACTGGPIHFRVVTTTGEPAYRARIVLSNVTSKHVVERSFGTEKMRAPDVLTLTHVPCGTYFVRVNAPGLDTRSGEKQLLVTPDEQWLTLGFPFDNHVDRYGPPLSVDLVGVLRGSEDASKLGWVKLVGVYTNEWRETQTNSAGTFVFQNLPEGLYVVILTLAESEPQLKLVRITATGRNHIEFLMP